MAEIIDQIKVGNTTYDIKDNVSGYITSASLDERFNAKQDKLISGSNIKTINNKSIVGNGNIEIDSTPVYDGQLTIQRNSIELGKFSANQVGDKSINIKVPEKMSDLIEDMDFAKKSDIPTKISAFNNDAEYLKSSDLSSKYETKTNVDNKLVAWSDNIHQWVEGQEYVNRSALNNMVTTDTFNGHVDDKVCHITKEERQKWDNKSGFDGDYNKLYNKPELDQYLTNKDISMVALSGEYSDLKNKPNTVEKSYVDNLINGLKSSKQNKLTPGNNITIINDEIACSVNDFTAGDNITIENNIISAKDTTYTAGQGISIKNGVITNTGSGTGGGGLAGSWKTEAEDNSLSFYMEV